MPTPSQRSGYCNIPSKHTLDSMEGIDLGPIDAPDTKTRLELILERTPGVLLATAVALLAAFLVDSVFSLFATAGGRPPLDKISTAIILGILLGNLGWIPARFNVGLAYTSRTLLPLGVVCLGARLSLGDLFVLGLPGILLSGIVIALAVGLARLAAKFFNIPSGLAWLLGIGTGICGGTAIIAASPLLRSGKSETVTAIATVTLVGLVGMLTLPVLAGWLGLSDIQFGFLAGLTLHQTPQAIASGFLFSPASGEVATLVKLARVCFLTPALALLSLYLLRNKDGPANRKRIYLPWFVVGFIAMALLNTVGSLPEFTLFWPGYDFRFQSELSTGLVQLSGLLLAISMAAIGMETRFRDLKRSGLRAVGVGLLLSTLIVLFSLTIITLFIR